MALADCDVLTFVQALTLTWRKSQQVMLAYLIQALQERPSLCPTDIARALPPGPHSRTPQSLHGRLKRLNRLLSNPRLDEAALFVQWLHLSYHFGADVPDPPAGQPILVLLLDTTYFDPCAALVISVPCGGRGLPVAWTTYHRETLEACFPPQKTWPTYDTSITPPARRQRRRGTPASSVVKPWVSQNRIEEHLVDYLWSFLSPALWGVVVADRGFARASFFRWFLDKQRAFAIRFKADTWLYRPDGTGGPAQEVLPLQPGQCHWLPEAYYGQEERVPVAVLALWEAGQEEPWYIATNLPDAQTTETVYRWRTRIESSNRDEKTGVLLREGGDNHQLEEVLHLHRLLLANCCAQWLAALAGLQAYHDLPAAEATPPVVAPPPSPLERALPNTDAPELLAQGPASPPPVVPHRGPRPALPAWMRRFAVWGPLSYVRLGLEILRTPDLGYLVRRAVRWLAIWTWRWRPAWAPWQVRYRLKHWWPLPI
jgi:hypothetical protein